MKDLLRVMDKNLFQDVKEGRLTLNQLQMRVLEKVQGKSRSDKYICLDDLRASLDPSVLNFDNKEIEQYIKIVYRKELKDLKAKDFHKELE